jgi:hypothetical protein
MPAYESLQAKAIRKLSPTTLRDIPSYVLDPAKNELAKHIQRTYRNKNYHATYRKGSKMTKNAMQRQLYNAYANPGNNINDILNTINRILVNDYNLENADANQIERRNLAIKYIIDNLERPLLEKVYNITWDLYNTEEDETHITNPTYFPQNTGGNRSKKIIKNKSKRIKYKSKNKK